MTACRRACCGAVRGSDARRLRDSASCMGAGAPAPGCTPSGAQPHRRAPARAAGRTGPRARRWRAGSSTRAPTAAGRPARWARRSRRPAAASTRSPASLSCGTSLGWRRARAWARWRRPAGGTARPAGRRCRPRAAARRTWTSTASGAPPRRRPASGGASHGSSPCLNPLADVWLAVVCRCVARGVERYMRALAGRCAPLGRGAVVGCA